MSDRIRYQQAILWKVLSKVFMGAETLDQYINKTSYTFTPSGTAI